MTWGARLQEKQGEVEDFQHLLRPAVGAVWLSFYFLQKMRCNHYNHHDDPPVREEIYCFFFFCFFHFSVDQPLSSKDTSHQPALCHLHEPPGRCRKLEPHIWRIRYGKGDLIWFHVKKKWDIEIVLEQKYGKSVEQNPPSVLKRGWEVPELLNGALQLRQSSMAFLVKTHQKTVTIPKLLRIKFVKPNTYWC